MRTRLLRFLLILLSTALTSGCWDQKTVQDLNYLQAIGIDYVKDRYIVYAQSTDLSTFASQETSSGNKQTPAIISKGEGKTLQNAIDNMQKNAQIPQFSGFVSALVFHERTLQKGVLPLFDILNRYGLLRYTKWVFSTREPIDEVLKSHVAAGFSPLVSILHQPYDVYEQRSFIEPIQYYKFSARFWEPSNTVLLPNLTIYEHSWKEDGHYLTRLTINGVQAIHRGKWRGFFEGKDLLGLRWMNPHTEFAGLVLWEGKDPVATLRFQHIRMEVQPFETNGNPRFRINLNLRGFVREMMSPVTLDYVKKEAEKQIAQQVRGTFANGIKKKTDLYSLESFLYRYDYPAWKRFAQNHKSTLSEDAIAELNISIHISDSGKMKFKWFEYPEDVLP